MSIPLPKVTKKSVFMIPMVWLLLEVARLVVLTVWKPAQWPFNPESAIPVQAISYASSYRIPRKLHQTWKVGKLPRWFQIWSDTCKGLHEEWEYTLWNDHENYSLVAREFPWFLNTWRQLPYDVSRVDAIRYMVLYSRGGVFMDLDIECLAPFDPLLARGGIILSEMNENRTMNGAEHTLPNSWIAAAPKHPFWLFALQMMQAQAAIRPVQSVEKIGGSIFLRKLYLKWLDRTEAGTASPIQFAPTGLIYPYDWRVKDDRDVYCSAQSNTFDPQQCKRLVHGQAVAVSYWTKVWGNPEMLGRLEGELPDSTRVAAI
ncbi:hypothetical protein HDV03_003616 [Kappamyces sp. JEL0829]|nr:hypothetical protein HDV03_003616 [Kappamyces sp. JEL0829]